MNAKDNIESISDVDGVRVVRLAGDFNKDTTPGICNCVKSAAKEIKGVLLDFGDVDNIDSTAFACMVDVIKEHIKDGVGVGVINLPHDGTSLVEVLKIGTVIHTFDNEEEGVEFLLKRWE